MNATLCQKCDWRSGNQPEPITRQPRTVCVAADTGTAEVESFRPWLRWDLLGFALVIALANVPVFGSGWAECLVFLPDRVAAGEWWRLLTHPFLHVSWYHLVLDAAAFLLLYHDLRPRGLAARLGFVIAAAAGSLMISLWLAPAIADHGLCGLSAIAHGLMAVVALDLLKSEKSKWVRAGAWCAFACVITKATLEAATGQLLFQSMHLGMLGTPVAVGHAGGVLGALAFWLVLESTTAGRGTRSHPGQKLR